MSTDSAHLYRSDSLNRGTPAVFLDKDGTLVEDVPYNVDPDKIRLTAGAIPALQRLRGAGFRLVLVSNQSGVARGYFPEEALDAVWARLGDLLEDRGLRVDGYYYCPHHPDGVIAELACACRCRKPAAGLLLRASFELDVDLRRSWLVGDILDDIEAGRRAGCRTVLLANGNETEWLTSQDRQPHYTATDLNEAAGIILADGVPSGTAGRNGVSA